MQMAVFGGKIKGYGMKEVFIQDNLPCVRFENENWYHYQLDSKYGFKEKKAPIMAMSLS